MKFYDCKTAPSPRRVRVFIVEKGIDIETVQVDLAKGEQFSDAFKQLNPDCVVPALELDDGTGLTEVVAICDYLEAKFPEHPLMGSSDEERARVLMWNCKVEQQGLMSAAAAFRNSVKGLKGRAATGQVSYAQIPELAERGRAQVVQFFERMDEQLANTKYLAGENFSIADIGAMCVVDFAAKFKVTIPESASNTQRWYDSVSARPSAAA